MKDSFLQSSLQFEREKLKYCFVNKLYSVRIDKITTQIFHEYAIRILITEEHEARRHARRVCVHGSRAVSDTESSKCRISWQK